MMVWRTGMFTQKSDSSGRRDSAPQSIPIQIQVLRNSTRAPLLAGRGDFVKEQCSSGLASREGLKPIVLGQIETVTWRALADEVS
jgi:hypothetical protein